MSENIKDQRGKGEESNPGNSNPPIILPVVIKAKKKQFKINEHSAEKGSAGKAHTEAGWMNHDNPVFIPYMHN